MQFGFRDRKTKKNDPASELMEISHKLRAWIQDDTSAIPNNQSAASHQQTPLELFFSDMLPKFRCIAETAPGYNLPMESISPDFCDTTPQWPCFTFPTIYIL